MATFVFRCRWKFSWSNLQEDNTFIVRSSPVLYVLVISDNFVEWSSEWNMPFYDGKRNHVYSFPAGLLLFLSVTFLFKNKLTWWLWTSLTFLECQYIEWKWKPFVSIFSELQCSPWRRLVLSNRALAFFFCYEIGKFPGVGTLLAGKCPAPGIV